MKPLLMQRVQAVIDTVAPFLKAFTFLRLGNQRVLVLMLE